MGIITGTYINQSSFFAMFDKRDMQLYFISQLKHPFGLTCVLMATRVRAFQVRLFVLPRLVMFAMARVEM